MSSPGWRTNQPRPPLSFSSTETSPSSSSVIWSRPSGDFATPPRPPQYNCEDLEPHSGPAPCLCLNKHTPKTTHLCARSPEEEAGVRGRGPGDYEGGGAEGGASTAAWQRSPCKRRSTHTHTNARRHNRPGIGRRPAAIMLSLIRLPRVFTINQVPRVSSRSTPSVFSFRACQRHQLLQLPRAARGSKREVVMGEKLL